MINLYKVIHGENSNNNELKTRIISESAEYIKKSIPHIDEENKFSLLNFNKTLTQKDIEIVIAKSSDLEKKQQDKSFNWAFFTTLITATILFIQLFGWYLLSRSNDNETDCSKSSEEFKFYIFVEFVKGILGWAAVSINIIASSIFMWSSHKEERVGQSSSSLILFLGAAIMSTIYAFTAPVISMFYRILSIFTTVRPMVLLGLKYKHDGLNDHKLNKKIINAKLAEIKEKLEPYSNLMKILNEETNSPSDHFNEESKPLINHDDYEETQNTENKRENLPRAKVAEYLKAAINKDGLLFESNNTIINGVMKDLQKQFVCFSKEIEYLKKPPSFLSKIVNSICTSKKKSSNSIELQRV